MARVVFSPGDGIEPAPRPGVAAKQTPYGKPRSLYGAKPRQRHKRILGACRQIPALGEPKGMQPGRKNPLVDPERCAKARTAQTCALRLRIARGPIEVE